MKHVTNSSITLLVMIIWHYNTLKVTWFLQYTQTHPTSSEKQARSRAGGHFYLTNHDVEIFNNGAVLTISTIIKHIMASSSEAEIAAMFYNSCKSIPIHITLEEIGYPQPPTNVTVNTSTVHGLTQGTMITKKSKAMDMRFHWLKWREEQGHIRYLWWRVKKNLAEYHTKHHPPQHYREMCT